MIFNSTAAALSIELRLDFRGALFTSPEGAETEPDSAAGLPVFLLHFVFPGGLDPGHDQYMDRIERRTL